MPPDYERFCDQRAELWERLAEKLRGVSYLETYPSQANYVLCRVKPPYRSKELATKLLAKHGLLIKDLSVKDGFSADSSTEWR